MINKIGIDSWGYATFRTDVDYPLNEYIHVTWVKTATTFSTSSLIIFFRIRLSISVIIINNIYNCWAKKVFACDIILHMVDGTASLE